MYKYLVYLFVYFLMKFIVFFVKILNLNLNIDLNFEDKVCGLWFFFIFYDYFMKVILELVFVR